jgi:calnexin
VLKGIEGDKGLGKGNIDALFKLETRLRSSTVVKNVAAHHAISAKFDKPIDNTGKTLVVQYEVKLQSVLPSKLAVEAGVDSICRWP